MNLPFITEQKPFTLVECGNAETGIIKLVKKGFISVAEQIELDEIELSSSRYRLAVGELLYRIMQEKNVTQQEATGAIDKPGENLEISGDYLSEINQLISDRYLDQKINDVVRVTTMIKHRGLSEEEISKFEKLDSRKFVIDRKLVDWDNNRTKELPQDLFVDILKFFVGEQQGTETEEPPNPSVTETKSSEKELMPESQTGEKSSGNSRRRKTKGSTT